MQCETTTCEGEAEWRFTWPGRPEMQTCTRCAARAVGVAEAMGFDLEVRRVVVVLCERHHVEHAEKLGQLQTTSTPKACAAAAVELRGLEREISDCKRI